MGSLVEQQLCVPKSTNTMSNSQSQRPKGLISKLSSRNRRRRREQREEKIPIPSFSFTPSQQHVAEQHACQNGADGGSALETASKESKQSDGTTLQQLPRVQTGSSGKENIPESRTANNAAAETFNSSKVAGATLHQATVGNTSSDDRNDNSIPKTSCDEAVVATRRLSDQFQEKRLNITIDKCPLLADVNVQISSSDVSNPMVKSEESVTKATEAELSRNNSSLFTPNNMEATKQSDVPSGNCPIGSKRKPAGSDATKDDTNSSSLHGSLNATDKSSRDNPNGDNGDQSNAKRQKIESTGAAAPSQDESAKTKSQEKQNDVCTKVDTLIDDTAKIDSSMSSVRESNLSSLYQHDTKQNIVTSSTPIIGQVKRDHNGSSPDLQVVAAPIAKPSKPKSRNLLEPESKQSSTKQTASEYFRKADESSDSDASKLGSKTVKKELVAKKKRKKPAVSNKAKVEVINLGSDSDSSSSADGYKPPPKKRDTSKSTASAKVEKKVKASAQKSNSTKAVKQKSTRVLSKSSSSDGKKLCFACSTCKCNSRDGTSATPSKQTVRLSGSHARQERALINRLQKIERNVQWMESQKHDVGRQLMKYRNTLTKKWVESNPVNSADKPKFLVDIDEKGGDELNIQLEAGEVKQANVWIFGEAKGTCYHHLRMPSRPTNAYANSFIVISAKTAPKTTLTQHFGISSKSDTSTVKSVSSANQEEDNVIIESNLGPLLSPIDEELEADEEDLQNKRALAHLTSMVDFAEAIACSKECDRVSSWQAATTAPAIASKLNEFLTSPCSKSSVTSPASNTGGLDELLQLFAHTPSKLEPQPACLNGELNIEAETGKEDPGGAVVGEDMELASQSLEPPLTPRGKQIADEIERSVSDEPTKLDAVERTCPEWRDNVKFAQLQTDPKQLRNALEAVKKSKSNVQRLKERILQALMDREQTLELFEHSLERSMDRLVEK